MDTIWLQRPSYDVPWGFRLMGGADYGQALQVLRVTPGSIAATGLSKGDVIRKIGEYDTLDLTHAQSMDVIKESGNLLQLSISKSGAGSQVSPQESSSPSPYTYSPNYSTQSSQDDSYTRDMSNLNIGYNTGYNSHGQDPNMQYANQNTSQNGAPSQSYAYNPNSATNNQDYSYGPNGAGTAADNSFAYDPGRSQQSYQPSQGSNMYKPVSVNPYQASSPKPFSPGGYDGSQSPSYAYQPHTPTNTMSSPSYPTSSPGGQYQPTSYQPNTPPYQPTSPTYQPSTPTYSPSSPAYTPSTPTFAAPEPQYTTGSLRRLARNPSYHPDGGDAIQEQQSTESPRPAETEEPSPKKENSSPSQRGPGAYSYIPDNIATQMMKGGDKKPFSYTSGITDEIKEKQQERQQNYQRKKAPTMPNYMKSPNMLAGRAPAQAERARAPATPTQSGPTVLPQYNTPVNAYSHDNVMDSFQAQTGAQIVGVKGTTKPAADITKSATYKFIHEGGDAPAPPRMTQQEDEYPNRDEFIDPLEMKQRRRQGLHENDDIPDRKDFVDPYEVKQRREHRHGADADDIPDRSDFVDPYEIKQLRRQHSGGRPEYYPERNNFVDPYEVRQRQRQLEQEHMKASNDEMTFSGISGKTASNIPSKAFACLQRMTGSTDEVPPPHPRRKSRDRGIREATPPYEDQDEDEEAKAQKWADENVRKSSYVPTSDPHKLDLTGQLNPTLRHKMEKFKEDEDLQKWQLEEARRRQEKLTYVKAPRGLRNTQTRTSEQEDVQPRELDIVMTRIRPSRYIQSIRETAVSNERPELSNLGLNLTPKLQEKIQQRVDAESRQDLLLNEERKKQEEIIVAKHESINLKKTEDSNPDQKALKAIKEPYPRSRSLSVNSIEGANDENNNTDDIYREQNIPNNEVTKVRSRLRSRSRSRREAENIEANHTEREAIVARSRLRSRGKEMEFSSDDQLIGKENEVQRTRQRLRSRSRPRDNDARSQDDDSSSKDGYLNEAASARSRLRSRSRPKDPVQDQSSDDQKSGTDNEARNARLRLRSRSRPRENDKLYNKVDNNSDEYINEAVEARSRLRSSISKHNGLISNTERFDNDTNEFDTHFTSHREFKNEIDQNVVNGDSENHLPLELNAKLMGKLDFIKQAEQEQTERLKQEREQQEQTQIFKSTTLNNGFAEESPEFVHASRSMRRRSRSRGRRAPGDRRIIDEDSEPASGGDEQNGVGREVRYKGGAIPSKSFAMLQLMTDTHNVPPPARHPHVTPAPAPVVTSRATANQAAPSTNQSNTTMTVTSAAQPDATDF